MLVLHSNDGQFGDALMGDVNFNLDQLTVQADHGASPDLGQHRALHSRRRRLHNEVHGVPACYARPTVMGRGRRCARGTTSNVTSEGCRPMADTMHATSPVSPDLASSPIQSINAITLATH